MARNAFGIAIFQLESKKNSLRHTLNRADIVSGLTH